MYLRLIRGDIFLRFFPELLVRFGFFSFRFFHRVFKETAVLFIEFTDFFVHRNACLLKFAAAELEVGKRIFGGKTRIVKGKSEFQFERSNPLFVLCAQFVDFSRNFVGDAALLFVEQPLHRFDFGRKRSRGFRIPSRQIFVGGGVRTAKTFNTLGVFCVHCGNAFSIIVAQFCNACFIHILKLCKTLVVFFNKVRPVRIGLFIQFGIGIFQTAIQVLYAPVVFTCNIFKHTIVALIQRIDGLGIARRKRNDLLLDLFVDIGNALLQVCKALAVFTHRILICRAAFFVRRID